MFVLLQAPNDGYYMVVRATSAKHFSFVDKGYAEIDSGSSEEIQELKNFLEKDHASELICLKCEESGSLIQTTDYCLNKILEINPDYLENKQFL